MSAEHDQLSFMPQDEPAEQRLHSSAEFFGVTLPEADTVPQGIVEKAELQKMQPVLPKEVLGDVELEPEVHALRALDYFAEENRAAGRTKIERGAAQRKAVDRKRAAAHNASYSFAQAINEPVKTELISSKKNKNNVIPTVKTLDLSRQTEFDSRNQRFRDLYAGTDPENIARRDRVREGREAIIIPPK